MMDACATTAAAQVCITCLDTDSEMLSISEHHLEEAYQHLTGYPVFDISHLKHTLCEACLNKLSNFAKFREDSLRARTLLMAQLVNKLNIDPVKLVSVKTEPADVRELEVTFVKLEQTDSRVEEGDSPHVKCELQDLNTEMTAADSEHVVYPTTDPGKLPTSPTIEPITTRASIVCSSVDSDIRNIYTSKCSGCNDLIKHTRKLTRGKPCKLCKYKFSQNDTLAVQMKTHTGEKPLACTLCSYKCKKSKFLLKHMNTHTGEKLFACNLCEYKCSQNRHLVMHMRTHTGEKPFACKLCHYKCSENSSLVKHMRTHTGEKPFACELCHYKCSESSSLVKHMRTHTGEKPFSCKLCHYKCSDSSSLTKHMRTHTDDKPFACKVCHYRCSDSSNLVVHMRKHADIKPFACNLCKYTCSRKTLLVSHNIGHHSGRERRGDAGLQPTAE